jgi:hypothetical protein
VLRSLWPLPRTYAALWRDMSGGSGCNALHIYKHRTVRCTPAALRRNIFTSYSARAVTCSAEVSQALPPSHSQGNETSISACTHQPWGVSNCRASEAVGLQCGPPTDPYAVQPAFNDTALNAQWAGGPKVIAWAWPEGTGGTPSFPGNVTFQQWAQLPPALSAFRRRDDSNVQHIYRIIIRYANGASSCPSRLTADVSYATRNSARSTYQMGDIAVQLNPLSQDLLVNGYYNRTDGPIAVVQRLSSRGSTPYSGWVDAFPISLTYAGCQLRMDGFGWAVCRDNSGDYNASSGIAGPDGPNIEGWRWRYGSVGRVDLYDVLTM